MAHYLIAIKKFRLTGTWDSSYTSKHFEMYTIDYQLPMKLRDGIFYSCVSSQGGIPVQGPSPAPMYKAIAPPPRTKSWPWSPLCTGPWPFPTYVDTIDTVEGVCYGFLPYTRFLGFPEFSGYHQWQQESQWTTRTNWNNLKALLIITTIAKDISKYDTSNFEENKVI